MSFSGTSSWEPHTSHATLLGKYSLGSFVNHASAPSVRKSSITASNVSSVATVLLHLAHLKTGIGTPHERWREMHQSGRSATIEPMRFEAHSGIHVTSFSMTRMVFSRRPVLSIETNHWSVARKITGLWQRQQWG